jgi:CBS domain-containing protein
MTYARDVMQRDVITIEAAASLLDAHRLFVKQEISGAPVVDEDGRVVGVLSARDLLRALDEARDGEEVEALYFRDATEFSGSDWDAMPEDYHDRLAARTVSELMSPDVISVSPDAGIAEVARTLRANRVHRVLVATNDAFVGLISTFDLLALLEKDAPQG